QVEARGGGNQSKPSAESATATLGTAPSILSATSTDDTHVQLIFTLTPRSKGYAIFRGPSGGALGQIATIAGTDRLTFSAQAAVRYIDSSIGLTAATAYQYTVAALL